MSWPPTLKPETPAQKVARLLKEADARRGSKVRAPRKTMEADFQIAIVQQLRVLTIAPARFWFVPNGGNLSKAQAGKFKEMGLTSGVHDLHFAWDRPWPPGELKDRGWMLGHHGPSFGTIELKAGKNTTSGEQDGFGDDMRAMGHFTAVHHAKDGVDAVIATLRSWGFPLRLAR